MKKSIFWSVILAALVGASAYAQNLGRLAGVIFAADRGVREAATLNTIITAVGARDVTVVLDTGTWTIDVSVSFPLNVALVVLPGAVMDVSAGANVDIVGPLMAGDYAIFSGDGNATGPADFAYRYPSWGDTDDFDVGVGKVTQAAASVSVQDPVATVFNTWTTNTINPGAMLTAYSQGTNTSGAIIKISITPSDTLTPTTLVSYVIGHSNALAFASALVPYNYLYYVGLTNPGSTNATYLTGLLQE